MIQLKDSGDRHISNSALGKTDQIFNTVAKLYRTELDSGDTLTLARLRLIRIIK